jgi:hypothetical protein
MDVATVGFWVEGDVSPLAQVVVVPFAPGRLLTFEDAVGALVAAKRHWSKDINVHEYDYRDTNVVLDARGYIPHCDNVASIVLRSACWCAVC